MRQQICRRGLREARRLALLRRAGRAPDLRVSAGGEAGPSAGAGLCLPPRFRAAGGWPGALGGAPVPGAGATTPPRLAAVHLFCLLPPPQEVPCYGSPKAGRFPPTGTPSPPEEAARRVVWRTARRT